MSSNKLFYLVIKDLFPVSFTLTTKELSPRYISTAVRLLVRRYSRSYGYGLFILFNWINPYNINKP